MTKYKTESQRFWEKVLISDADDCWDWAGYINNQGYGCFYFGGKTEKAHRVSWILSYGEIPYLLKSDYRGTCVLHKCDNRKCVNPNHLFLGTNDDNMKDMAKKGRAKNHPRKGIEHPLAKLNEKQVIEIRKMYSTGMFLQKDLAKMYKVTPATIGLIIRKINWSHINEQ